MDWCLKQVPSCPYHTSPTKEKTNTQSPQKTLLDFYFMFYWLSMGHAVLPTQTAEARFELSGPQGMTKSFDRAVLAWE